MDSRGGKECHWGRCPDVHDDWVRSQVHFHGLTRILQPDAKGVGKNAKVEECEGETGTAGALLGPARYQIRPPPPRAAPLPYGTTRYASSFAFRRYGVPEVCMNAQNE